MTIRQIRRLLPFWQDVLNLREWKITIRYGTAEEMSDNVGLNYISVEELESLILLSRHQEDVEETLVHELLHLVYDGHKPQDWRYDAMHERALNRTAKALVTLARMAKETNAE